MGGMVNVPQIFMSKIFMAKNIRCSEFLHSNSKILDLEYFTLKISQSSIFIGFLNIWYQNVWKSIIYSKNLLKKERDR